MISKIVFILFVVFQVSGTIGSDIECSDYKKQKPSKSSTITEKESPSFNLPDNYPMSTHHESEIASYLPPNRSHPNDSSQNTFNYININIYNYNIKNIYPDISKKEQESGMDCDCLKSTLLVLNSSMMVFTNVTNIFNRFYGRPKED